MYVMSADVLFQYSVFRMSVEIVRCAANVLEVILLRSGLLQLPGFAVSRQDYGYMLDAIVG